MVSYKEIVLFNLLLHNLDATHITSRPQKVLNRLILIENFRIIQCWTHGCWRSRPAGSLPCCGEHTLPSTQFKTPQALLITPLNALTVFTLFPSSLSPYPWNEEVLTSSACYSWKPAAIVSRHVSHLLAIFTLCSRRWRNQLKKWQQFAAILALPIACPTLSLNWVITFL